MNKLVVIVPCYNCEPQAIRVAHALDHFLSTSKYRFLAITEIIFIDNQSTDKTVAALHEVVPTLKNRSLFRVAQNSQNYGLGGTHKAAFHYALKNNIDYVAIVHGDNQADATELSVLIENCERFQDTTVLGSRFSHNSKLINYSKSRSRGNMALNLIYSLLLRKKIEDLGSGLNIFNMKSFQDQLFLKFDDQFTFNMDVLIYLVAHRQNICFVPISWKTEDEVSNALSWKVGRRALSKILEWTFSKEKMWQTHRSLYEFRVLLNG